MRPHLLTAAILATSPALACDSDAPLPTSARELRAERVELQRRLAMVEQRLVALGDAQPAPSRSSATTMVDASIS